MDHPVGKVFYTRIVGSPQLCGTSIQNYIIIIIMGGAKIRWRVLHPKGLDIAREESAVKADMMRSKLISTGLYPPEN